MREQPGHVHEGAVLHEEEPVDLARWGAVPGEEAAERVLGSG